MVEEKLYSPPRQFIAKHIDSVVDKVAKPVDSRVMQATASSYLIDTSNSWLANGEYQCMVWWNMRRGRATKKLSAHKPLMHEWRKQTERFRNRYWLKVSLKYPTE